MKTQVLFIPFWINYWRHFEWVFIFFSYDANLWIKRLTHYSKNYGGLTRETRTCKIVSFLCSLENLLQKSVIVFFFGNQITKWRSFEKKRLFLKYFSQFSHQGKVTKIPSAHISLIYIHVLCSPYWLFLPYQFLEKKKKIMYGFSLVWLLVLILIRDMLEQSIQNCEQNLSWNVCYW